MDGLANLFYWQALVIGVCQALAMIPGVSRSAATVIGALAVGVKRKTAVEFSFLLAVPTMVAATGYDLYKHGAEFSTDQVQFLAIGFVTSFMVALVTIRFLLRFVQTHTFFAFGVYRIVAALTLWLVFATRTNGP